MIKLAKFILALMVVLTPFGVAMLINFAVLKAYFLLTLAGVFVVLIYMLIDCGDSIITYKNQIKKLEAEITQLKRESK